MMIFCSASSREGSVFLVARRALGAGPAAAAFLRGVPGGAGNAVLARGAARLRGGVTPAGGAGGLRAMGAYSGFRRVGRSGVLAGEADLRGRGVVLAGWQEQPAWGWAVWQDGGLSGRQAHRPQPLGRMPGEGAGIVGRAR